MKIDKTTGASFIQSYQKLSQVTPVEKTKRLQKEDQLQISNQAKQMFEKTADVDVERQKKIDSLKAQIQAGEYHVNSEKVAGSVHQFWFNK